MIKFLKFSFAIVNLSYIKQIDIQPDKYSIHLGDNNIKGSYNFLKLGEIFSTSSKIDIYKIKNPHDYNKMSDWIASMENDKQCF